MKRNFVIVITLPSGNQYAVTDKENCLALVPMVPGEMVTDVWAFNSREEAESHIDLVKSTGEMATKFFNEQHWEIIPFQEAPIQ